MAETDKVKIVTKIASFDDVQKSLQEVENKLNSLIKSVNDVSEKETSETEGKSGDINITRNADGTYGLETCTNEGWKKMFVSNKTTTGGISEVYLGDKPKIATKLSTTHAQDSRYVPYTPDYDSGWIDVDDDATVHTLTHNLDAYPRLWSCLYTPDTYYNSGDPTRVFPHAMDVGMRHQDSWAGMSAYFTKTEMKYRYYDKVHVVYGVVTDSNAWSKYEEGYIRVFLWK